ncbi:MAG: type IV pilus twitching motility protein PilT [Actinomycetes bacterium]
MATKRTRDERMAVLLAAVWDRRGTDLHLTAGCPPLIRVDGQLVPFGDAALTAGDTERLVAALLSDDQLAAFADSQEIDFSFNWHDRARFRGNAFLQRGSISLALRLIPFEIPTFDDLGVPESVRNLVDLPQGFVLVTGPTGGGKSTTLASMIDRINRERRCHVLTIEDPIEYVHEHRLAAINQREVGNDTPTFGQALRSALREDPDVLLVGEMRDLESIQTALTIAETGHLVLATLHTNDSAQALDRIVDVFPSERRVQIQVQLAHVVAGVVYQRLLPKRGGGLVAAFEVMLGNQAVRNLIREGKTKQLRNVVTTHQGEGMRTLEMSLNDLTRAGVIDHEVARSASLYPRELDAPTTFTVPDVDRLAVAGRGR